jgi:hypothetical protein
MEKHEAPPPGFHLLFAHHADSAWFGRVAWSPHGSKIATGASDDIVRVWNSVTGKLLATLNSGPKSVVALAWLDEARLITWGHGRHPSLRVWPIGSDAAVELNLEGAAGDIQDAAVSRDGRTIAATAADHTVGLWDAESGNSLPPLGESRRVMNISWSPAGRQLAFQAESGSPWLRDADSGAFLVSLAGRWDSHFRGLAWSPDGKLLAAGVWNDPVVLVWKADTGGFVKRLEGHLDRIKSVSFSSDGSLLASKSSDGTVRLWRTSNWELVEVLLEPTASKWPPSLAFHPSEPILATLGDKDATLRIWRLDLLSKEAAGERQALRGAAILHRRLVLLEEDVSEWVLMKMSNLSHPHAVRHLRHGFLQRHLMMVTSRRRIFDETHNRGNQLTPELTPELNVHVNAYYLNLCGALDNLAWMLAFEFQLQPALDEANYDHRRFCSLFGERFLSTLQTRHGSLADQLREHQHWHGEMRKFRDPAAHRIPLYMVPGVTAHLNPLESDRVVAGAGDR